ncbi:hypothetical protein OROMI_011054 [Orobanche minor]
MLPVPSWFLGFASKGSGWVCFSFVGLHFLLRQSNYNNALPFKDHRLIIEYQSDDRAGIIFDDVMTEDLKDVACFLHKCIRNFSLRQIHASAYFWQFRLERLEKLLVWILQYYFKSKKEKQTFMEILLTAGVDRPDDMLFVTSNLLQAFAAKASGCTDFLALGVGVLLVLLLAFAFGCSLCGDYAFLVVVDFGLLLVNVVGIF